MKTFVSRLNRIFKTPLFAIILFFSFLFVGALNTEKAEAYSDFEIYYTDGGWSASGHTITITEDYSYYYFDIYHTADASLVCVSLLSGNDVLVSVGYNYPAYGCSVGWPWDNLGAKDDYTRVKFSTDVSSPYYEVNDGRCTPGCYDFFLPMSYLKSGSLKIASGGAGFMEHKTITFVDKAPPSRPTLTNDSGGNWTNGNVYITAQGSIDYVSGIARYEYSYDLTNWKTDWDTSSSSGVTGTWTAERNDLTYIRACDNAGNCSSTRSTYVRIDKTAPSSAVTITNSAGGNWTNQDILLTFSGGVDSGTVQSGFSYYQYSYDATNWDGIGGTHNGNTWSDYWSAERNNTLYARVCDVAGNCSSASSTTTQVKIDKTNPNGTITIGNTSSGNWTNQPVTITASGATDTANAVVNSGIAYYRYSYDNSTWSWTNFGIGSDEYNNANGVIDTWAADRDNDLYISACDYAGNCITASTTTKIRIDTHAPEGTISIHNDSNGNWTNQQVYVRVGGANDAVYNGVSSGLKQYDWGNGSGWYKFHTQSGLDTADSSGNAIWSGETDFILTPRVCDNAGNCLVGDTTTRVRIDKTNPNNTLSMSNSSGGNWTNQDVVINLSGATDKGTYQSGIYKYQYRYNSSDTWKEDWDGGVTGTTGRWVAERDVTIYFRVCDSAGNCSDESETTTNVRIDKTNPTGGSLSCSPYCDAWTNQTVELTASGSVDTTHATVNSGIAGYKYSYDNVNFASPERNYTSYGQPYWTGDTNHTVHIRAYDNAGNYVYLGSKQVMIDKTAPTGGTISCSPKCDAWTNQTVEVTLNNSVDALSGILGYRYSYDDVTYYVPERNYTSYGQPYWVADTNQTVYFRAYDNAGNYVYLGSKVVKVDKTAPTATITVTNKTAIINLNDNISIANKKIGSGYSYYMSKNGNVNVANLSNGAWINPESKAAGNDQAMNLSSGEYYLYVKVANTYVDHVGNSISGTSGIYSSGISGYTVFQKKITYDKNNFTDNSSDISESTINNKLGTASNNSGVQVFAVDRMLVITFDSESKTNFTLASINTELVKAGYKILTIDDSTAKTFNTSNVYHNVLVAVSSSGNVSTRNELFDIVININAPTANGTTGTSVSEITEGEDIGNIAVSFVSDIEFTVDTVISLDGVRVNKIDTSKPGVYEVKHIATDAMGRVNRVEKTIVVKEGVKEEVEVKEEIIEETPVIVAPIVVNNAPVERQVETTRKVVETQQVEMRVEEKQEVKAYKKKKETRMEKKDDLTFKLFSKWFFKVYDG